MEKILAQIVTVTLIFTIGLAHKAESPLNQASDSQTITYDNICTGYADADHNGFCDNCDSPTTTAASAPAIQMQTMTVSVIIATVSIPAQAAAVLVIRILTTTVFATIMPMESIALMLL